MNTDNKPSEQNTAVTGLGSKVAWEGGGEHMDNTTHLMPEKSLQIYTTSLTEAPYIRHVMTTELSP